MKLITQFKQYIQRLESLRSESGSYHFLVKRWYGIPDIELAAKVLETTPFDNLLKPVMLDLTKFKSVLVLAPHQDDECIGAGGTLLMLDEHGAQIHVAYITDGGVTNQPYDSIEDSIKVRNLEAEEACSQFHAKIHQIGISNVTIDIQLKHITRLAELIQELQPQVVMAPWILDSPPKHRLVNHMLWFAAQMYELPSFEVWGYQVHNSLIPNVYVDITEIEERKRNLIRIFRSQNDYVQCYDHITMGLNAWNARFLPLSPQPRYIELFFTLPSLELLKLVENFYFQDLAITYRHSNLFIERLIPFHKDFISGLKR